MAQFKNLIVLGSGRFIGDLLGSNIETDSLVTTSLTNKGDLAVNGALSVTGTTTLTGKLIKII